MKRLYSSLIYEGRRSSKVQEPMGKTLTLTGFKRNRDKQKRRSVRLDFF